MKMHFLFFLLIPLLSFGQQYHYNHTPLPCLNKKFTIVNHIVLDSFYQAGITEATIDNAIQGVTAKFEPICASFEACDYFYIEDFHFDTIVGAPEWPTMNSRWHETGRINVYWSSVVGPPADPICGFSSGFVAGLYSGGIMMSKDCPGALSHEMGHFFGLPHTFAGSGELVNGSNCETAGDQICDTPADPYYDDPDIVWVDENCIFQPLFQDANGEYYRPDVGNIMSYYFCGCSSFTYQQYLIMANNFLNAPNKMW